MSARLPNKVKVKLKDFDNDPRYKHYKGFYGICNEGKNGDEVWVNKNTLKEPSDTAELTRIHELVHVRRQKANEEYKNNKMEEDAVELEAVARCKPQYLNQAQIILRLFLIVEINGNKKIRLHPDNDIDLKKIHKKIKQILLHKYQNNPI